MSDRRVDPGHVVTLNSVGLSLKGIAQRLGCHHTTVAQILRNLGIPSADTRRSFMDDVWESLTADQRKHLASRMGAGHNIKDFVRSLIVQDYLGNK